LAAVALVLAGRVDPLEFVVAELRVAGAVAGEVGVGPLAAVAALVDVAVVVAEDVPPLVCRERQHDNARMALDTTDRQTVQSFFFCCLFHFKLLENFLFGFFFFTNVQLECSSTMFMATSLFSSKSPPSFKTGSGA